MFFDDLNLLNVTNMQKIKINRKGAKTFSQHCICMYVYIQVHLNKLECHEKVHFFL